MGDLVTAKTGKVETFNAFFTSSVLFLSLVKWFKDENQLW